MSRKSKPTGPSDKQLRELLIRYKCPTPFHAARTLFLGQIASPDFSVSPMNAVRHLWHGEMPEFENEAAARTLMEGLVNGLWNRLTDHQNKRHPFHLTRMNPPTDALTFARYTRVRREELRGFADGLFGDEQAMDLPETAHHAMHHLTEIRGFMEAMGALSNADDLLNTIDQTARDLVELTRIAEIEMNAAVLSCSNARRQRL
ncbi:MAG: hypothetical protein O3A63_14745 [Proteobacteria bacterium]|nr:hypothetical protein [Pseudomonadota bacterium]